MLRFISESAARQTRREWLRIGGLFGLTAFGSLAGQRGVSAEGKSRPLGFGKAKSVILVFASGGQSQFETWDPKPRAPWEIRGEFRAIPTSVPGVLVGEHLPRLAKLADRYAVVRSMSHEDLDHGSAFYLTMTGHYHNRRSSNPPPSPEDYPTLGAVLKRVRPSRSALATAVHVNGPAQVPVLVGPGQFGGFLGQDAEPLLIGDVTAGPIAVPGLDPQPELPPLRLNSRQSLLGALENYTRELEANSAVLDFNVLYREAFQMLQRPATRQAFDLSREPESLRDRYGRNRSGQACLLARRLVEAGVPLVTVIWNHSNRGQDHSDDPSEFGWDTHNDIFDVMKHHLLPRFDQSFSALLEDLDDRGLLDDTLVICAGEFGRAPLVALEKRFAGSSPGRKHWAAVYSVVFAGAGVGRGQVVGSSDARGAYPDSTSYGPWDIAATLYSALGINPAGHYTDPQGRPFPIAIGRPIEDLYGA